jgi:hypothetical protein
MNCGVRELTKPFGVVAFLKGDLHLRFFFLFFFRFFSFSSFLFLFMGSLHER